MDGADLMPADLLRVWDDVYRDYLATSSLLDAGEPVNRELLARVSARVSVTWRRMAEAVPAHEWWLKAALLTAAEAMKQQAQDWSLVEEGRND